SSTWDAISSPVHRPPSVSSSPMRPRNGARWSAPRISEENNDGEQTTDRIRPPSSLALFCRRDLFLRGLAGLFGLLIRILQELVDHPDPLRLLDLVLLRFLLFLEEPVVYFPTHRVLHP